MDLKMLNGTPATQSPGVLCAEPFVTLTPVLDGAYPMISGFAATWAPVVENISVVPSHPGPAMPPTGCQSVFADYAIVDEDDRLTSWSAALLVIPLYLHQPLWRPTFANRSLTFAFCERTWLEQGHSSSQPHAACAPCLILTQLISM